MPGMSFETLRDGRSLGVTAVRDLGEEKEFEEAVANLRERLGTP